MPSGIWAVPLIGPSPWPKPTGSTRFLNRKSENTTFSPIETAQKPLEHKNAGIWAVAYDPLSDSFDVGLFFNGIELLRSDFGDTFAEWVAYSIAFTASTECRDKAAVLELVRGAADSILRKVFGDATCIGCGCNDTDGCVIREGDNADDPFEVCRWLRIDRLVNTGVCSNCPDKVKLWDGGLRKLAGDVIAQRRRER